MRMTTPADLLLYCQKMNMSYSYKPVLIMALLTHSGKITSWEAANYFASFYASRLEQGLIAEKSNSIYSNLDCTIEQIKQNIVSNPIKALLNSADCFAYDPKQDLLEIKPELKAKLTQKDIALILAACVERLDRYYSNITSAGSCELTLFCNPSDENGFLSNNYEAAFSIMGKRFSSVTQYMAYRKALACGYELRSRQILNVQDQEELEAVYSSIDCTNMAIWNGQKQVIAYQGLISKFLQNEELGTALLNTGSTVIGACLPYDLTWGIGFDRQDDRAQSMSLWSGQNLLGFTLMQVRNSISSTRSL